MQERSSCCLIAALELAVTSQQSLDVIGTGMAKSLWTATTQLYADKGNQH
jgi:hypothetical protein